METIKRWLHDNLKWGYISKPSGYKVTGGDSFQPTYTCRFCGGDLAEDSQGNLFHLSTIESKEIWKKSK